MKMFNGLIKPISVVKSGVIIEPHKGKLIKFFSDLQGKSCEYKQQQAISWSLVNVL